MKTGSHAAHTPTIYPDVFLEELVDTAPEADCAAQTDEFLERPSTPPFVPLKSGADAATQIEAGAAGRLHVAPNIGGRMLASACCVLGLPRLRFCQVLTCAANTLDPSRGPV